VCRHSSRSFLGDGEAPRRSRAFVAESALAVIGSARPVIDDLALVCSELVTNAVRAGSPTLDVALDIHHSLIYLAVSDTAVGLPGERVAQPADENGRAWLIVAALTRNPEVRGESGAKTVSAELPVVPALTESDFHCDL